LCAALQITFDWAWSKGPLSGSGNGALALQGGSLDEIFLVSPLDETHLYRGNACMPLHIHHKV
jgi:hypothetical protein